MSKQIISSGLQIVGLTAVTIGVFMWSVPAGLVVAGGVALLIGFSLGLDK